MRHSATLLVGIVFALLAAVVTQTVARFTSVISSSPVSGEIERKEQVGSHNQSVSFDNTTGTPVGVVPADISNDVSLDAFRICRINNPEPVFGEAMVRQSNFPLPLHYQCGGEVYQNFTEKLYELVSRKHEENPDSKWGKRPSLMRLATSANSTTSQTSARSVLFMGNSHARQIVTELLCQYQEQILSTKILVDILNSTKNTALEIHLEGNLTIYTAFNTPFVYSPKWIHIFETKLLKRKLSSIDSIVLGPMHAYRGTAGTAFRKETLEYQKQFPEHEIDFGNQEPPDLQEVARVFNGPIIWLGMFSKNMFGRYQQTVRLMDKLKLRRKRNKMGALYAINPRNYIGQLGGAECVTDAERVGSCITDRSHPRYSNGHRCVGSRGGEPDLAAWDLVEALWKL